MPLMVDPNKDAYSGSGGDTFATGEGKKLALVTHVRWGQSKEGNTTCYLRWVVLEDLSARPCDRGKDVLDTVAITSNTVKRIASMAVALGHTQSFDAEDQALVTEIFTRGPCILTLQRETWQGKDRVKPRYYDRWDGKSPPRKDDWDQLADAGEERAQKWAAGSRSGRSSTPPSDGRFDATPPEPDGTEPAPSDDEIPF